MNTGIIVFAYNRSMHLKKVLDGLQKNKKVSKLYIFQDGLKHSGHSVEWEKTTKVINTIDWCEVKYFQSTYNKGLAQSIVDGINKVFQENDTVIVLEDDCVPASNYIGFMEQCFEKYRNDQRIYSVSGYGWPLCLPENCHDIYGCGRISSWGWGTWKDRWQEYSMDKELLMRIMKDEASSRYLAAWGSDCEQILLDRIAGRNDSWAIYWALHVIEKQGICINPYKSLIKNIGFDGSGVHCDVTDILLTEISDEQKTEFALPDYLNILSSTQEAFISLYGSYTAFNTENTAKENVLIYGMGKFYFRHEKEICDDYYVKVIIDRRKRGYYAGKKIIRSDEIPNYDYDKIIIMVEDIQECINIGKDLISRGIDYKCIVLGHSLYGSLSEETDSVSVLPDGRLKLKFGDVSVNVKTKAAFWQVYQVFGRQIYNYFINNEKRDIVIDVGMNTKASSLYFIRQHKVDRVFGYEPYGVNLDPENITIENETIMQAGISTEKVDIRKAAEASASVIRKYQDHNLVLKIDCKDEEKGLLKEFLYSHTLEKFNFIMINVYQKDKNTFSDYLKAAGFSWWYYEKSMDNGLIYAFR